MAKKSPDVPETFPHGTSGLPPLVQTACARFGITPDPDVRELLSWRAVDATRDAQAHVVLVTGGGAKITMYADGTFDHETEERLRAVFRAFRTDPVTKAVLPVALPSDLRLPDVARTGRPTGAGTYQHPGGYLRRESDAPTKVN